MEVEMAWHLKSKFLSQNLMLNWGDLQQFFFKYLFVKRKKNIYSTDLITISALSEFYHTYR